jgi:hypothetical protein
VGSRITPAHGVIPHDLIRVAQEGWLVAVPSKFRVTSRSALPAYLLEIQPLLDLIQPPPTQALASTTASGPFFCLKLHAKSLILTVVVIRSYPRAACNTWTKLKRESFICSY